MLGGRLLERTGQVQGVERYVVGAAVGLDQAAGLALDLHRELPRGVGVGEEQEAATLGSTSGGQVDRLVCGSASLRRGQLDLVGVQRVVDVAGNDVERTGVQRLVGDPGRYVGVQRGSRERGVLEQRNGHQSTGGQRIHVPLFGQSDHFGRGGHSDVGANLLVILHRVADAVCDHGVSASSGTRGVVVGLREVQRSGVGPLVDHVVDEVELAGVEAVGGVVILEVLVGLDVGHKERTAIDQSHPLVVGVGAHFLHGLTQVHPVGLTELAESRRGDHVALGQVGAVESRANGLHVVGDGLLALLHVGDGIASSREDELSTGHGVRVHNLHGGVEHAAGQVQEGLSAALASLADVGASADVAVSVDCVNHRVAHGLGDLEVVAVIASNVVHGGRHLHTEPSTGGVHGAELDAVDLQLHVELIALLDLSGGDHTVVDVGSTVEGHANDEGGNANAGHAKVANSALLEESLHSVVRIELCAAGGQFADQVLVLVQARAEDRAVEREGRHRRSLRSLNQHVDSVEASDRSTRGNSRLVDECTRSAAAGASKRNSSH